MFYGRLTLGNVIRLLCLGSAVVFSLLHLMR